MKITYMIWFCIVMLLIAPSMTSADFSETFSSGLDNWELWAENWNPAETGVNEVEGIEHGFEIDNGQLVSGGSQRIEDTWNVACTDNTNGLYGNWSVEVYSPKAMTGAVVGLYDSASSQVGNTEGTLNETGARYLMRATNFVYLLLENSTDGSNKVTGYDRKSFDPEYNVGWHIIRVERVPRTINLYFDETLEMTQPLTEQQLPNISKFCLDGGYGDQIRFDDVYFTELGMDHPAHTLP